MNIKNHGAWTRYTPVKLPEGAPPNALFAQRADGVDWYNYVNSGKNFARDSVKMTVTDGVVGAATTDPTALFPGGATVLEVSDVATDDPQKLFGRKIYDADKKTFKDPPPVEIKDPIPDLLKRIEALEKKGP